MAEILPRWEWRTFASAAPLAYAALDAMTPASVEESDEVYLLAPGAYNVKMRDGLMDVKVLRDTDAAGLQRWEPILKVPFPLDADAARTVFEGIRRPLPAIPPDGLTLDAVMAAVEAGVGAGPRAVQVHKRRAHTTRSAAAKRSGPCSRPEAIERGRSRSSRRTPWPSWPRSTRSACGPTAT